MAFVRVDEVLLESADVKVGFSAVSDETDILASFQNSFVTIRVLLEVAGGRKAFPAVLASVRFDS